MIKRDGVLNQSQLMSQHKTRPPFGVEIIMDKVVHMWAPVMERYGRVICNCSGWMSARFR